MLRYLDAFENFNPLEDKPSDGLVWKIGYLLQRGLALLPEEFTKDDLDAGLEILFALQKVRAVNFKQWKHFLKEHGVRDESDGLFQTEPFQQFLRSEFAEQPLGPNGEPYKWSWLFAIGSLACVSDYAWVHLSVFHYNTPPKAETNAPAFVSLRPNDEGAFNYHHKDDLLADAAEYLGFARVFREREEGSLTAKARGEAISKAKLDHFHELKYTIFTAYQTIEPRYSNRKAAKLIFEGLPEGLKLKFANDDPTKQIEKWIGLYLKNKLPGQERLPQKA